MAEANRSDRPDDPGTAEEVLRSDEVAPRSADVEAAIERQFGDDPDPDVAEDGGR